jgi:hypothetical protein
MLRNPPGIKNAGMVKMAQRSFMQYPDMVVIVMVTTYARKNDDKILHLQESMKIPSVGQRNDRSYTFIY